MTPLSAIVTNQQAPAAVVAAAPIPNFTPEDAVEMLIEARAAATKADAAVTEAEKALLALIDTRAASDAGTKNYALGKYKVKVVRSNSTTIPADAMKAMLSEFASSKLDEKLAPVSYKAAYAPAALELIKTADTPEAKLAYEITLKHIETKPSPVKISIEL